MEKEDYNIDLGWDFEGKDRVIEGNQDFSKLFFCSLYIGINVRST